MGIIYPFTEVDSQVAHEVWGANCGPNALAFALQISLDKVRPLIPGFEQKRYTSPTMMKSALELVGRQVVNVKPVPAEPGYMPDIENMFDETVALVRIQWEGPWTEPGANPRWAYRQTHWIVTWVERGVTLIFDVNGGIQGLEAWERDIVPVIVEQTPRASGYWHPTHIWRLPQASDVPKSEYWPCACTKRNKTTDTATHIKLHHPTVPSCRSCGCKRLAKYKPARRLK